MKPLEALTVMFFGVLKFFFSPIVSYKLNNSYWETVLLTGSGAIIGTLVFYLGGARFLEWIRLRRVKAKARALAKGERPKRAFTRTNRMIVRLKRGFGVAGVAFALPPVVSIPIAALIAAKYFRHDRRTLPLLLISVVAWTLILSAAWKFTR
jgi:hypothetical protein